MTNFQCQFNRFRKPFMNFILKDQAIDNNFYSMFFIFIQLDRVFYGHDFTINTDS